MRVLALDLAQHAIGWAADSDSVCPPRAGIYRTLADRRSRGQVLVEFSNWMDFFVVEHGIELIAYEQPILSTRKAVSSGEWVIWKGALLAIAEVVAYSRGLPVDNAPVQTWRKHFLGTGRPEHPKQATMERCRLLGWDVPNHDAADAAGLWAWAKARHDPRFRYEAATPLFAATIAAAGRVA